MMKVVLVAVVTLVQRSDGEGGRGGKPGEFHANREGRVPEFQTHSLPFLSLLPNSRRAAARS